MSIFCSLVKAAFDAVSRIELQRFVKKLGRDLTTEQKILLEERRSRLRSQIDDFEKQAPIYLGPLVISSSSRTSNIEDWVDLEGLDVDYDLPDVSTTAIDTSQIDESLPPESRPLPLPSAMVPDHLDSNVELPEIVSCEFDLRQGQANDALHDLRISIAYKSYLYRAGIRNNSLTQSYSTRSYGGVRAVQMSIEQAAKTYRLARKVMIKLKPSNTLSSKYPALQKEDLRASTAVADSNAPGQRSEILSWIWNVPSIPRDGGSPAHLDECQYFYMFHYFSLR